LNGAVQTAGGETLTWSDFVNAVKNTGGGVSEEDVKAAYEAYKNAPANTVAKKAAYDAALKSYDDAEKQLQTWQADLTTKQNDVNSKTATEESRWSTYQARKKEYDDYKKTVDAHQKTYNDWPYGTYKTTLKTDVQTAVSHFKSLSSRLNSSSSYVYYAEGTFGTSDGFANKRYYILAYTFPTGPGKSVDDGSFTYTSILVSDLASKVNASYNGTYPAVIYPVASTDFYNHGNEYRRISSGAGTSFSSAISSFNTRISQIENNDNNYNTATGYYPTYDGWSSRDALKNQLDSENTTLSSKKTSMNSAYSSWSSASSALSTAKSARDAVQSKINGYIKVQSGKTVSEQTRLKNERDDAKTAWEQALAEEASTREAYDELCQMYFAQSEADKEYLDVELTGDVVADKPLGKYSGTINGNGFSITAGDGVEKIFFEFSGTLTDAAVNGAMTGFNAKVHNVAYWDKSNSDGVYYDKNGAKVEYHDLGELAYNVRKHFGVDFTTGNLTKLDETNKDKKVLDLTLFRGPGSEQTVTGYYQITPAGTLINAKGETVTIPVNHFILSATSDVQDITIPNVVYATNNGAGYESNLVEIDLDGDSFYCPWDLTAKSVNVKGGLSTNKNRAGLTLPFAVRQEYFPGIKTLCTYNGERENSFVFNKVEQAPANTPVLIFSDQSTVTMDLSNADIIHFAKTPENQIVEGGSDATSNCYGTFRSVIAGEIGQLAPYDCTVWALKSGVFNAAKQGTFTEEEYQDMQGYGNAAKFKPFRMVITTAKTSSQNDMTGASRYVSLVDENGNELSNTSGIDCVEAIAGVFSVTGGDGEIIISSETDRGMVEVYDLTGRMIATADVKAGETRVSLQTGVYIVAGQKVMVK
ncbi:MAG: T9SS type A sorting domain-containing protein, partial [Muribaculaceae bacterium]|nr:T9SS type A sorting domain-containing protein [Muribaculaceae bacterium]